MSITVMKQALEALVYLKKPIAHGWDAGMQKETQDKAITSLRQAIAEAEKQEPVAWFGFNEQGECREVFTRKMRKMFPNYPTQGMTPVYTSPPQRQWVGLTEEEIEQIGLSNYMQVVRQVEAKLKEKNT